MSQPIRPWQPPGTSIRIWIIQVDGAQNPGIFLTYECPYLPCGAQGLANRLGMVQRVPGTLWATGSSTPSLVHVPNTMLFHRKKSDMVNAYGLRSCGPCSTWSAFCPYSQKNWLVKLRVSIGGNPVDQLKKQSLWVFHDFDQLGPEVALQQRV